MNTSPHFTVQKLSECVAALIASEGGAAIANAALIDLGDEVLAFDCTLTPQAGRHMLQASKDLFGRAPSLLIYSHYHNDHIWGAQAFAGPGKARVLCAVAAAKQIETDGKLEVEWYSATSAGRLAALKKELLQEERNGNALAAQQKRMWIGYYDGLVKAMPGLRVIAPSITFIDSLTIQGTKKQAHLVEYQKAHTQSDSVLFLPDEGTAFLADLLFVGHHPYLADGDPDKLLEALRDLRQRAPRCVVGGHGQVGTAVDLDLMISYIEECQHVAEDMVAAGTVSEAQIGAQRPSKRFASWNLGHFYQANLDFLIKRSLPLS